MRMSLAEILAATGGRLAGAAAPQSASLSETVVTAVTADSRKAGPGALFVCLPGEKADGHDFAPAAAAQGAAAILARRDPFAALTQASAVPQAGPVPVILVEDPLLALGRLAAQWRDRTRATVIGITGTAGKTTIKEVLAQVLEAAHPGRVSRNKLNFNNQLGLPLSMLEGAADDRFWVMEIGISQPQDMDELGAILRPDLALVLNVGDAHTEGLGERGVAWHKARLLHYARPGGSCLVCADYPDLLAQARLHTAKLVTFSGQGAQATYRARYLGPEGDSAGRYLLEGTGQGGKDWALELRAPFRGGFGAENVAAIGAAALELGLGAEELVRGLAAAVLPQQRFSVIRHGAWIILDDSYNANPLSMHRMLEAAADLAAGPFVCVLGEMGELGSVAEDAHRQLGEKVAASGASALFWKGGHTAALRKGLDSAGFCGPVCEVTGERADFLAALDTHLPHLSGGLVLFKGSRANKLEILVQALHNRLKDRHAV